MKTKPKFAIEVTRAEFLKLPMPMRRRTLRKHADVLLLRRALDALALALTLHAHTWTAKERSLYEQATGSLPPPF